MAFSPYPVQLDTVIQQNASSSEELAASSEELNAQAEALAEMVGYFRLIDTDEKETVYGRQPDLISDKQ